MANKLFGSPRRLTKKERMMRTKRIRAFSVQSERGRLSKQKTRIISKRTFKALTVRPKALKRFGKASRAVGRNALGAAKSPRTRKNISKVFRTTKGVSDKLFGKPSSSSPRRTTKRRR